MAINSPATIVGNIVNTPELRFTPEGKPVAAFTVAENHRSYNSATNQWEDGKAEFYRVSAWGDMAHSIAESLTQGMEVIVVGKLSTSEYSTREGERRFSLEIAVNYGKGVVAPVLSKFQTATVTKVAKGSQQGAQQAQQPSGASDWNTQPQAQSTGHNWASGEHNPPF